MNTTDKGADAPRVTDEELALIARNHAEDERRQNTRPSHRDRGRLLAEVTALRTDLARVAGGTPDQQIEAWRTEAHEQEDAAEDAQEELEEAEEQIAEASAALTAIGHPDDGKTLAQRIAAAREETMAHLHAARAEVAERDAQIARLAVDSAAVEAKLTIEAMAANQRADAAEKLAADLRAKAWALLCARTLVADEGGIITGCSTAALLAYNGAAVDLAAAVGKDDKR